MGALLPFLNLNNDIMENTMSEVQAITATTKATSAILKAAEVLAKQTVELGGVVDIHEGLLGEVAEAQQNLDAITKQTETAVREAGAELALEVKENRQAVLAGLMEEFGYASISTDELRALYNDLDAAKADQTKEITAAVKAAVKSYEATANTAALEVSSAHKVAVAEKDATINAQVQEIGFQTKTIERLEDTITAERVARVQEAEARSKAQGVNITTGKQ